MRSASAPPSGRSNRSWSRRFVLSAALLVGGLVPSSAFAAGLVPSAAPVPAATDPAPESPVGSQGAEADGPGDKPEYYDARNDPAVRPALQKRAATLDAQPEVRKLRRGLGTEGIVDMDPVTGTPRKVARTDGFLTGPSEAAPRAVALSYVRRHNEAFRLSEADLDRLELRKDYVDVEGTHHLSFQQSVDGVPVFGNGLKAHVSRDGRLISVDGSPVAGLPTSLTAPGVGAAKARAAATEDVFATPKTASATTAAGPTRSTVFAGGDRAHLVVFATPAGPRTAWQTITSPSKTQMYLHVIDAASERVLFRRNLVDNDRALVHDNYPGAPEGGTARLVDLPTRWLPPDSSRLAGNVAHVYSDVDDSNAAESAEEIVPSARRTFAYPLQAFDLGGDCSAEFPCTWDPSTPNSWQANRAQGGVQLFYFIGKFHDHLAARPIGFTRRAGNFEAVDGDAVQGEDLDGADTADGLPDPNHIDNANFATPPDGIPPRMQMFLWRQPGAPGDPFLAAGGANDSSIVYHEYTHGLSNRLVVDAGGVSTLGNIQAGSMGEAWSDWYPFDFLVADGLVEDTAADGDLRVGEYVGHGTDLIRTQPLDCPVGSRSAKCPGTEATGPGGYTYGDFGKIAGAPEVHADGEIWAATLWDLREEIGATLARSLVTRAMELSPANPSFLDMRNSILQADVVVNRSRAHDRIWQVFAGRGMGYFAGSVDGDDTAPVEDFSAPPPPGTPTGSLTGTVTEADSGAPVAGATVAFGGHNSGFAGDLAGVTEADGTYTIDGVFPGTYPKVFAGGPGFDRATRTVSVSASDNRVDWEVRRNWAALSGGGEVTDFNGDDFSDFGCGPAAIFDQSQGSGWSTDAVPGDPPSSVDPRFAVVKLPAAVDVSEIAINPTATCGDGASASTGDFRVETSVDGITWTVASEGHFGIAERNQMNSVELTAGTEGVQFVRYTMLGTQLAEAGGSCPGNFSGCSFVDSVELAVYGTPAG
jgi:extracellular elastinolytic metalloproteinase